MPIRVQRCTRSPQLHLERASVKGCLLGGGGGGYLLQKVARPLLCLHAGRVPELPEHTKSSDPELHPRFHANKWYLLWPWDGLLY